MKNIELLAPAGDQESLIAAIQNGANAIYLGGTMFNARAFAKNFDKEQLKWAVEYAHERNVRIFVTVNTLFGDEDFEELTEYLDYLYEINADALIIQDIGLFHFVKRRYMDFEVHISTQASCMNKEAVAYFQRHGADRVVLARENTIEEIKEICDSTSLDIEVFVHGALCVGYSGQCLMSSFIGKRSGNKGACAQPCRLAYDLYENNKCLDKKLPFILSPKDLMTIDHVDELIEAGITSFKIEGRMKRPEYVASVVSAYRKAIDNYFKNKKEKYEQEIYNMKSMFNRDYTKGFLFHDKNVLVGDYSGNKGIIIGKVKSYNKKFKRVLIELSDLLLQGDSIVFENIDKGRPVNKMYFKNKLVSKGDKNQLIEIEFDHPVYDGYVRKTINTQLIKELNNTYHKEFLNLPIVMHFTCLDNQYATLKVSYKNYSTIVKSESLVSEAINKPLDKERIISQLTKLGSTQFTAQKINVKLGHNVVMPIKELNEMRRKAIENISNQMKYENIHSMGICDDKVDLQSVTNDEVKSIVLVSSLSQLHIASQYDDIQLAYPYKNDFKDALDYMNKQNKELIMFIPRIMKQSTILKIKEEDYYFFVKKVIVNEIGSYNAFNDKEIIVGTGMNIYNSYSANNFNEDKILSLELTKEQYYSLKTDYNKCYVQVFGKVENMISEYCPITQYYFGYQNKNCNLCKTKKYSLKDRKGEFFDLMMDDFCRMHLLNCRTLFIDDKQLNKFIHFTNENEFEVKYVLDYFILHKDIDYKKIFNITNGYFK